MSVDDWLRSAIARLEAEQIESAQLESQLLLAHSLGWTRSEVLYRTGDLVGVSHAEELLARRLSREPLAYILGSVEFFGRRFIARPGALIPRQDSETLIELALAAHLPIDATVADLGTGSGCLAITLVLERPHWRVLATDISPDALAIARENAQALGASVEFFEGDWCAPLGDQSLDLIVCNPPYVGPDEPLAPELVNHEPHLALYADNSGLKHYQTLSQDLKRVLKPTGLALFEIGYRQGKAVRQIFAEAGWQQVSIHPDLAGRDRVVSARRS